MTGAEVRRAMGFGQGTLAQKQKTHRDPFAPSAPIIQSAAPAFPLSMKWFDEIAEVGDITILDLPTP